MSQSNEKLPVPLGSNVYGEMKGGGGNFQIPHYIDLLNDEVGTLDTYYNCDSCRVVSIILAHFY